MNLGQIDFIKTGDDKLYYHEIDSDNLKACDLIDLNCTERKIYFQQEIFKSLTYLDIFGY